ncbi:steroid receptor RNA activator 1-like isoform X2 [Macrobrachium nipponense]|uniref:steroid receptor RNA activator 1-like isoform X2 n=1 Tax=Macrobrachium nipponense TaxID=159736 RepID=UPI0030C7E81A
MDPIGPGNHERAWNDPPKFAFNSSGSSGSINPSGRRRLLNKRVPVPIGASPGTSPLPPPPPLKPGDGPPVGSPPLGSPHIKPPTDMQLSERTVFSPKSHGSVVTENRNPRDKLQEVETSFTNSLERISEQLKDNVREEIVKRFDVMKTMWLEGKLNDVVQDRLVTLSKALNEENFDEAWAVHQGLIVDFTSMCSPWMIGIKTLVAESRNEKQKLTSSDQSDKSGQTFEDSSEVPMALPLGIGKVLIPKQEESEDEVK